MALRDELSSFRSQHHSGDRFAEELVDRRGETERAAQQRKLWDLSSSDGSDDDADTTISAGHAIAGSGARPKSLRSPEARILRKVGRGWERGDLEKVSDEDSRRHLDMRDVEAVARQCFELFAQDGGEHAGGISPEAYIDVEAGVHERLGLPFVHADAAAEYAEEIVMSRGGACSAEYFWLVCHSLDSSIK